MGKRLVIAASVMLSLLLPHHLWASADNWRIGIAADNGLGGGSAFPAQIGALPTSADGPRAADSPREVATAKEDEEAYYSLDFPQQCRWVAAIIPGDPRTWSRDMRSPASPASYPHSVKIWDLRLGAMPRASNDPMRIRLYTLSAETLPPSTIGALSVGYRLIMVDNKGMAGAPQNGRTWDLPIPTAHSRNAYWTLPQADWLPILKLSTGSHDAMISEGYQMRFEQYEQNLPTDKIVPEPAGLSVLGIGVIGLVGLAIRRRR